MCRRTGCFCTWRRAVREDWVGEPHRTTTMISHPQESVFFSRKSLLKQLIQTWLSNSVGEDVPSCFALYTFNPQICATFTICILITTVTIKPALVNIYLFMVMFYKAIKDIADVVPSAALIVR